MATQTDDAEYMYGFYHPEGAGYLFVDTLGSGSQARVDLVYSCASRDILVRKKTFADRMLDRDRKLPWDQRYSRREVRMHRHHPLVPELIDWTTYRPVRTSFLEYQDYEASSLIFQFCNGGTLAGLISVYDIERQRRHLHTRYDTEAESDIGRINRFHAPHLHPCGILLPEALIWKAFGQLLKTINYYHSAQPGICHGDLHGDNVFLHRSSDDQSLPDFYVGDFGFAKFIGPIPENVDTTEGYPDQVGYLKSDLQSIARIVKSMLLLQDDTWDSWQATAAVRAWTWYSPKLVQAVETFDRLVNASDWSNFKVDWDTLGDSYMAEVNRHLPPTGYTNMSAQAYPLPDSALGPGNDPARDDTPGQIQTFSRSDVITYPVPDQIWQNLFIDTHKVERTRTPKLFNRTDFASTTVQVPGPWKVAKVLKDTFEVVAISKCTYLTYWPMAMMIGATQSALRDHGSASIPRSSRERVSLNRDNLQSGGAIEIG